MHIYIVYNYIHGICILLNIANFGTMSGRSWQNTLWRATISRDQGHASCPVASRRMVRTNGGSTLARIAAVCGCAAVILARCRVLPGQLHRKKYIKSLGNRERLEQYLALHK